MKDYEHISYYLNLKKSTGKKFWDGHDFIFYNKPPISSKIPIDWSNNPFNYRSWMLRLAGFEWLDILVSKYKFNKDNNAIIECIEYFKDFYDYHVTKGKHSDFSWYDHAVSLRTHRLVVVIKIYQDIESLDLDKNHWLLDFLDRHFHFLTAKKEFKKNNHGIFQVQALASLIYLFPKRYDFDTTSSTIYSRLEFLWLQQFGVDLVHKENSPMYHKGTLRNFEKIINAREFSVFQLPFTEKDLVQAELNYGYFFHPDGSIALLGDTKATRAKSKLYWSGVKDFKRAGYLIFSLLSEKNGDSYLVVRSGYPSSTHRHSDDFSFEYTEKNVLIFSDSGSLSYDYNDPMRQYLTSRSAHNTIDVKQTIFPWWGDSSQTDLYDDAVVEYRVRKNGYSCHLSKVFKSIDIDFTRKIDRRSLGDGSVLFSVSDKVSTGGVRKVIQWFHFSPSFYVLDLGADFIKLTDGNLEVFTQVEKCIVDCYHGSKNPISGWISYTEGTLDSRLSVSITPVETKNDVLFNTEWVIKDVK